VNRTGLAIDPDGRLHDPGAGHPESPERLQVLMRLVGSQRIRALEPVVLAGRPVTDAELLRVHTPAHLQRLRSTAGMTVRLDADTVCGPRSWEAARSATGYVLAATEAVVRGEVHNAFAIVRPPGHHAEPDKAMGFCLLNHVAIAARHAREVLGMQRVAIVDFDVHHGNGTQAAFWRDPSVLYISTHQTPLFPGTGAATDMGEGLGQGRTVNIPLRAGHGDAEYDAIYGALIPRMLERFRPDLLLVSAGFDIAASDPLGGMEVTPEGLVRIAAHLVNAAELLCKGRMVMVLEGGYSAFGLEEGVSACFEAMSGRVTVDDPRGPMVSLPLGDAAQYLDIYREFFPL
jgi:acetoin utilization deacetylase AcuC-like enzyme